MNKRIIPLLMLLISVSLWLIFYQDLPDQVPMQWGLDGSVNWTASKLTALLANHGMYIFLYLVLIFSPKLDPKKSNYNQFKRSYEILTYAILGMFFIINLIILFKSLGYPLEINFFIPILIGVLFIVIGNYMQTVKTNWFIGIRTPWTLGNETVWRKTHRFGSKVFIILGLMFIITPFLPTAWMLPVILVITFVGPIIPIIYSYIIYRKLK